MMRGLLVLLVIGLLGLCIADPLLKASPAVLTPQQPSVTLAWSGITNPTSSDFLALYNPAPISQNEAYIGWIPLTQSANYLSTGSGQIVIPNLVNLRAEYVFQLWVCGTASDCSKSMKAVATSNTVAYAQPLAPAQGHLALTASADALVFMWVSGANDSSPSVQYGISTNNLQYESAATTTTYGMKSMCFAPANNSAYWKNPGFIHSAVLGNLQPSTQYFYRFGSNTTGWSETYFFISPQPQSPDEELFVVAYGDMGVMVPFNVVNDLQVPSLQTAAWVQQLISTPGSTSPFASLSTKYRNSSLPLPWTVLHIGDISYARGYGFLWDYFFDLIQPVATQVPYMVCIGNHEFDYYGMPWRANDGYGNDSGGECGVPYNLRFTMPGEDPTTRNLWYSYNQGPAHFVFMSSEHDFVQGSAQYNWIMNDLANIDRAATPWIVFSGHRPAYTSSAQTTNESIMIRETYEPLWIKFRVNLCLWGHVHVYERTCGVQNFTCVDNDAAPVHVVIGMAGNDYQVPWASADLNQGRGHAIQPEWSIFRTVNYGFSRFFANGTHFNFQFVGDQRGEVHDSFWLTQY